MSVFSPFQTATKTTMTAIHKTTSGFLLDHLTREKRCEERQADSAADRQNEKNKRRERECGMIGWKNWNDRRITSIFIPIQFWNSNLLNSAIKFLTEREQTRNLLDQDHHYLITRLFRRMQKQWSVIYAQRLDRKELRINILVNIANRSMIGGRISGRFFAALLSFTNGRICALAIESSRH